MTDQNFSPRSRVGIRFALISRAWRRKLDVAFADLGLTDATWAPLVHLAEYGDGISQKELAARIGVDASTLVRLMDILEERKLIQRVPDETDRRARKVFLSAEGRKLLAKIQKARGAIEADILGEFGEEDIVILSAMLDRIDAGLQQLDAPDRPRHGA